MAFILKRMKSVFSSSAPTIKVEAGEEEVTRERFSDVEERDGDEENDAVDPKKSNVKDPVDLADMKNLNGFEELGEKEEGGEGKLPLQKTKMKRDKKPDKGKTKSKKAKDLEWEEEYFEPETADVHNVLAPERQPSRDSQFEDMGAEGVSGQEELPKLKRAKKANGEEKGGKAKEAVIPAEEPVELAPQVDSDDPATVANLLNAASKRERVENPSKPRTLPQVIIIPRTRPTLMSITKALEKRLEAPRDDIIPDDLSELPKRIKNAKEKLKESKKVSSEEYVTSDEEGQDDLTAVLRKPLTPASISHPHGRDVPEEEDSFDVEAQIQMEAQSSAHSEYAEEDGTLKPASKKALGKRKASAEMVKPVKKRMRRKEQGPQNADIRKFGTIRSSQAVTTSPRPHSESRKTPDLPTNVMGEEHDSHFVSPVRPPRVHGLGMELLNYGRRGTPQWSPINKRVVGDSDVHSSNLRLESVASSAEVRKEVDEPARPENPAEPPGLDDDFVPPEDDEPSDEDNTYRQPEDVESEASEVQSEEELEPRKEISPPALPSALRKHRLPTGEPEASRKRPASKTPASKIPARAKSTQTTPRAATSTPRPRTASTTGAKGLTSDEIDEIMEAVESYQLQNDMESFALNALVQTSASTGSEDLREFWNQVCGQVPDIPRQKVMNLCRRKFHNFIRGSWSEEQDNELRDAYDLNPGKWKIIGDLVNRFPEDCRLRWRDYLVCGANQKKDIWDNEEEDRLRETVQDCLQNLRKSKRTSNDAKFKNADEESQIDWQKVSKLMEHTRSRLQCMSKWKSLKEREDTDGEEATKLAPIGEAKWRVSNAAELARAMKPSEKLRLLRAIRDSAAGREGKIPWRTIAEELNRKGRRMVLKVCFRNLRVNVPNHKEMKLQDVITFLIDVFEAAVPNEPQGFEREDIRATMASQSKINSKRKRNNDSMVSSDDGDELSGNYRRKRLARSMREKSEKFLVEEPSGIGEGPSTRKSKKSSRPSSRKKAISNVYEGSDAETPVPKKRKRTIRDRMSNADPSASQETNTQVTDDGEDIGAELKTAWTSLSRTPQAKKPIMQPKLSQRKRARHTDDEVLPTNTPPPVNEGLPKSDDNDTAQLVKEAAEGDHPPQPEEDLDIPMGSLIPDVDGDANDQSNENPEDLEEDDSPMENGFILSQAEEDDEDEEESVNDLHSDDDDDVKINGHSTQDNFGADEEAPENGLYAQSDDEEYLKVNGHSTQNDDSEDEIVSDQFADFTATSRTAPGGPTAYDSSDDSEDEFRRKLFKEDSWDDDDEYNITMTGFQREESIDLDSPPEAEDHRSNSYEAGSPFSKVNGFTRSPSVSSDDTHSSILAVERKALEVVRRSSMEGSPVLGENEE